MADLGSDRYEATVPAQAVGSTVEYWIGAADESGQALTVHHTELTDQLFQFALALHIQCINAQQLDPACRGGHAAADQRQHHQHKAGRWQA